MGSNIYNQLMKPQACQAIFTCFRKHNPHPTTELNYRSHFELLVAVILSAQATDANVNKATAFLFKVAHTPQQILNLGLDQLKEHIKSIGLYHNKATHILKTCKLLLEHHQGRVPHSREALEALPGVGRKTANVILNTCFGQPVIAVDTHIFRVAKRIGLADGNTPLAIEQALIKTIPAEFLQHAHHWLILHGRYICKAKKPLCMTCPISQWCEYPHKNTAS